MLRKFCVGALLTVLPFICIPNATAQAPRNACTQFDQTFMVFFESNSAAVAPIGEQIIEQALTNVGDQSACAISHVTIEGHTDTSGTAEKNMFLSHAMALNLKDTLVEEGVDKRVISTTGRGETMLMKKTQDDVRSPRNRRAEVKIFLAPKE